MKILIYFHFLLFDTYKTIHLIVYSLLWWPNNICTFDNSFRYCNVYVNS